MRRRPIRGGAADIEQKGVDDLSASGRVGDLRMKLDGKVRPGLVFDSGDRTIVAGRRQPEPGGDGLHKVAVTHPDGGLFTRVEAGEEPAAMNLELGPAILAPTRRDHLGAGGFGDQIHPVAEPQHWHPEIEDPPVDGRRSFVVDRIGTTGEDDAPGRPVLDPVERAGRGMDLAVDVGFPHPPGDQLGELGAVVEDQNGVLGHSGYPSKGFSDSPRNKSSTVSRARITA